MMSRHDDLFDLMVATDRHVQKRIRIHRLRRRVGVTTAACALSVLAIFGIVGQSSSNSLGVFIGDQEQDPMGELRHEPNGDLPGGAVERAAGESLRLDAGAGEGTDTGASFASEGLIDDAATQDEGADPDAPTGSPAAKRPEGDQLDRSGEVTTTGFVDGGDIESAGAPAAAPVATDALRSVDLDDDVSVVAVRIVQYPSGPSMPKPVDAYVTIAHAPCVVLSEEVADDPLVWRVRAIDTGRGCTGTITTVRVLPLGELAVGQHMLEINRVDHPFVVVDDLAPVDDEESGSEIPVSGESTLAEVQTVELVGADDVRDLGGRWGAVMQAVVTITEPPACLEPQASQTGTGSWQIVLADVVVPDCAELAPSTSITVDLGVFALGAHDVQFNDITEAFVVGAPVDVVVGPVAFSHGVYEIIDGAISVVARIDFDLPDGCAAFEVEHADANIWIQALAPPTPCAAPTDRAVALELGYFGPGDHTVAVNGVPVIFRLEAVGEPATPTIERIGFRVGTVQDGQAQVTAEVVVLEPSGCVQLDARRDDDGVTVRSVPLACLEGPHEPTLQVIDVVLGAFTPGRHEVVVNGDAYMFEVGTPVSLSAGTVSIEVGDRVDTRFAVQATLGFSVPSGCVEHALVEQSAGVWSLAGVEPPGPCALQQEERTAVIDIGLHAPGDHELRVNGIAYTFNVDGASLSPFVIEAVSFDHDAVAPGVVQVGATVVFTVPAPCDEHVFVEASAAVWLLRVDEVAADCASVEVRRTERILVGEFGTGSHTLALNGDAYSFAIGPAVALRPDDVDFVVDPDGAVTAAVVRFTASGCVDHSLVEQPWGHVLTGMRLVDGCVDVVDLRTETVPIDWFGNGDHWIRINGTDHEFPGGSRVVIQPDSVEVLVTDEPDGGYMVGATVEFTVPDACGAHRFEQVVGLVWALTATAWDDRCAVGPAQRVEFVQLGPVEGDEREVVISGVTYPFTTPTDPLIRRIDDVEFDVRPVGSATMQVDAAVTFTMVDECVVPTLQRVGSDHYSLHGDRGPCEGVPQRTEVLNLGIRAVGDHQLRINDEVFDYVVEELEIGPLVIESVSIEQTATQPGANEITAVVGYRAAAWCGDVIAVETSPGDWSLTSAGAPGCQQDGSTDSISIDLGARATGEYDVMINGDEHTFVVGPPVWLIVDAVSVETKYAGNRLVDVTLLVDVEIESACVDAWLGPQGDGLALWGRLQRTGCEPEPLMSRLSYDLGELPTGWHTVFINGSAHEFTVGTESTPVLNSVGFVRAPFSDVQQNVSAVVDFSVSSACVDDHVEPGDTPLDWSIIGLALPASCASMPEDRTVAIDLGPVGSGDHIVTINGEAFGFSVPVPTELEVTSVSFEFGEPSFGKTPVSAIVDVMVPTCSDQWAEHHGALEWSLIGWPSSEGCAEMEARTETLDLGRWHSREHELLLNGERYRFSVPFVVTYGELRVERSVPGVSNVWFDYHHFACSEPVFVSLGANVWEIENAPYVPCEGAFQEATVDLGEFVEGQHVVVVQGESFTIDTARDWVANDLVPGAIEVVPTTGGTIVQPPTGAASGGPGETDENHCFYTSQQGNSVWFSFVATGDRVSLVSGQDDQHMAIMQAAPGVTTPTTALDMVEVACGEGEAGVTADVVPGERYWIATSYYAFTQFAVIDGDLQCVDFTWSGGTYTACGIP